MVQPTKRNDTGKTIFFSKSPINAFAHKNCLKKSYNLSTDYYYSCRNYHGISP